MIGQTISQYKILEKLGEGGMGVVYKAEDTKLHRPVALKVLPRQALITEEDKTRFAREAQAAASLSHPNIAIIHEFDEVDDPVTGSKLAFIAMEYVDGQTVKQKIKERPLPIDEALKIALSVAEGLAEAHGKGIIHRDIKSENIMISGSGVVKIMDFGLAEIAGRSRVTKEGMTVGTAAYMSPEQALGEKLDQRTDIWSLGVVLYEMITGRLPFAGDYEQAIVYRILNEEPEPITSLRSNVPMELERIVRKAMQKDRGSRYQHVDEILTDLRVLRTEVESGLTKTRPIKARPSLKKRTLLYGGVGVLLALLFIALYFFLPSKPTSAEKKSIAVLPFANMSADKEDEYFSDGMTEELINALAKVEGLRVPARTSAFMFKGKQEDVRKIGEQLNVSTILEGSVRKAGGKLRITAQLINASDGYHLWSETFDREMKDVFATQDEISRKIVDALKIKLVGEQSLRINKQYTHNVEAYQLYLQGRFHWNKRTSEGFLKAIEYFQRARQKDPQYAPAYAGLSDAYAFLGDVGMLAMPPKEAFGKARVEVLKALEIDSTLSEAHNAFGHILMHEWRWADSENELRRAIELNPNDALAHGFLSLLLRAIGRIDDAIAEAKLARDLDPLSPIVRNLLGNAYTLAKQFTLAEAEFRKIQELGASALVIHRQFGLLYERVGKYEEALREYQKAAQQDSTNMADQANLAFVLARSGKQHQAKKVLQDLRRNAGKQYVDPLLIAEIHTALGEYDKAFDWLDKAYATGSAGLLFVKVSSRLEPLHSDPRFKALLEKMGLEK